VPREHYDIVVFENKFPSFAPDAVDPDEGGSVLTPTAPGRGVCEVVLYSDDHQATLATSSERRIRNLIEVWADRYEELGSREEVDYVFIFENKGEAIGVTLHHPHGQIYAYPYVPPRTAQLIRQARAHREAGGGNLLADVLAAEQRAGERIVLTGEHWTAYVPAAARWPVEVHLAPHRDVPDVAALDDAERDELAHVYLELLRRADRYFEGVAALPYIAGWHQAPVGADRPLGRLHLQLFSILRAPGKLKYLAGSESGMGAFITDTNPEDVAEQLRAVKTTGERASQGAPATEEGNEPGVEPTGTVVVR